MTKLFIVLGDTSSHGSRGDLDTIVVCFWCLSTVASTGLISRFRYGLIGAMRWIYQINS